jgi:hypothetical protein
MANNKMAVSLSDYTAARTLFQEHYFLAECNTDFGGQEQLVPWSDLQTEVDTYITANSITADDVALRFVHCYNVGSNALYLRVQLCTLVLVSGDHYTLDTTNSAWYEINAGGLSSTSDTDLYNTAYLENFYYCDASTCSNNTLENLALDTTEEKYVRNIVFPWGKEILPMYDANQDVESIGFGACSFTGQNSGVVYPHTLTLFLLDSNKNKLMDDNTYTNPFEMKGCDLGTICPTCCDCYNTPS